MNNAGIVAQYGFLFQRKAFVLFLLKNLNTQLVYYFEGKDDIEITLDDKIYLLNDNSSNYVQVKSGIVDENCFNKIIGNWLLLDNTNNNQFTILLENDLNFSHDYNSCIDSILQFIFAGKEKRKTAIARKVYDKYKVDIKSNDSNTLKEDIAAIFKVIKKKVLSINELESEIEKVYFDEYCADIKTFEMAKHKRLEKFIQSIYKHIDDSINNKKECKIVFSDIIKIISNISENISDTRYSIDITEFKKGMVNEAEKIVREHSLREVLQLSLVNDKEKFVIEGIVKELLYKDFRSVYIDYKTLDISNIEAIAKDNFDSLLYDLEENVSPKDLYNKTTAKIIESDFLPKGGLYSTGCYIFLTSENVDEDKQITWGISDESE